MISSKYTSDGAPGFQQDLEENHQRSISLSFIKNVSDAVGAIALAKEEDWSYHRTFTGSLLPIPGAQANSRNGIGLLDRF